MMGFGSNRMDERKELTIILALEYITDSRLESYIFSLKT
jgi:hypothetical protein